MEIKKCVLGENKKTLDIKLYEILEALNTTIPKLLIANNTLKKIFCNSQKVLISI